MEAGAEGVDEGAKVELEGTADGFVDEGIGGGGVVGGGETFGSTDWGVPLIESIVAGLEADFSVSTTPPNRESTPFDSLAVLAPVTLTDPLGSRLTTADPTPLADPLGVTPVTLTDALGAIEAVPSFT